MESTKPIFWIIDDDPCILEILAVRFQKYQFVLLQNRKMLLKLIQRKHVPCTGIILDYKLKYNIDAFDLLPILNKHLPYAPIIMISAYGTKDLMMKLLKANIYCFHDKPIDHISLEKSLKEVVALRAGSENESMTYKEHIDQIHQSLQQPRNQTLLLKDIAAKQSLSYKYISRLYKKQTGLSFSATQTQSIIDAAKDLLLNTPLSIREISNRLGYQYPSSFMRLFKNQTGLTASEFREKYAAYAHP